MDGTIRFKLIRSLIESLKQFRRIANLKIIVALRSDVLERVVQETGDIGFQREKFEDYFVRIKWSQSQLKDLISRRIDTMFKRQYSSSRSIKFEDIFQYHIDKKGAFEYIIEHTLMRPRDIISFVNECFLASEDKGSISNTTIRQAEREYSRKRRQALEYEWKSAFPSLSALIEFVARLKRVAFSFHEICARTTVDDLALTIASKRIDYDPLFDISSRLVEGSTTRENLMKDVACVLYRVGAIGIRPDSRDKYYYSHIDHPIFDSATINSETMMRVHPMLHSSMGIDGQQDSRQAT